MNDKLFSFFSNPIKAKIFSEIYEHKKITAGQLLKKYNEISQATLYCHPKKMLDDGIIKVVDENQISGTV